ncbi:MAG: 6,7-dimethyl-8-ribityllumazine synthase [Coxiellaceae bacterium]|nr:6,7-dimethyl-8-ribityllumazine synthase [Coxiellaceae bacterium]
MSVSLAIVYSRFNSEITDLLLQGAQARLKELDFDLDKVPVYQVPGAVEIPLVAKKLAKSKHYHAVICLGAVIRGETTHYDYVCDQVSQGCQQVMMEFELPVIFGVLTTENKAQALDRCGGAHGHKGRDAVDAAIEMVALLEKV